MHDAATAVVFFSSVVLFALVWARLRVRLRRRLERDRPPPARARRERPAGTPTRGLRPVRGIP
jgi:hypothetical protein